jgi:predicted DNA-binding antitoxin AbrB/MazE fold protein
MTVAVDAVYENGVLRLSQPLALREHTKVRVTIEDDPAQAIEDDDPTGWKTAHELIGCITEDLAGAEISVNHDQYIYRHDP